MVTIERNAFGVSIKFLISVLLKKCLYYRCSSLEFDRVGVLKKKHISIFFTFTNGASKFIDLESHAGEIVFFKPISCLYVACMTAAHLHSPLIAASNEWCISVT